MAGSTTNAELRQMMEQLEAIVNHVRQTPETGDMAFILARMARLEVDYAVKHEASMAEMELILNDGSSILQRASSPVKALLLRVAYKVQILSGLLYRLKSSPPDRGEKVNPLQRPDYEQTFEAVRVLYPQLTSPITAAGYVLAAS
ncbi:hypothetical protein K7X08_026267 [Anisodus acutangulus]|uniref:Uncharacterized protein n=1 Tax=Anisodus acutangulus TaxID=402998 RepID=A0A9Q1RUZ6_9SOLA|nr:hypothetical protein K7X08_026267 [Anisodus acutangulus]